MKRLLLAATMLLTTTAASAELMGQAPAPTLVRGTVTSLNGQVLTLTTKAGVKQTITLAPKFNVATTSVIGIDAIKPDSFIGTAAEPGKGGKLTALEVHVFPEAMRGLGEGHRPWDTSKTSSMTNGNVRTVGAVKHGKGARELLVDYKGGQQVVVVPASVPIVSFAPGTLADVKPGSHVFAITQNAGGKLAANSLVVGANGSTPPM